MLLSKGVTVQGVNVPKAPLAYRGKRKARARAREAAENYLH